MTTVKTALVVLALLVVLKLVLPKVGLSRSPPTCSPMHVHVAFWLAVALVAVASVAIFKTLLLRVQVPGLSTLAAAL